MSTEQIPFLQRLNSVNSTSLSLQLSIFDENTSKNNLKDKFEVS